MSTSVFHLGLQNSDLNGAKLAILPGDPGRVQKIACLMKNFVHLKTEREFVIWRAEIDDQSVVVCSTGIGGPSTSIVVEELSQLGVRIFLRIGTSGSIQNYINVGDLLIVNASVRLDGASRHFAPIEFPAVSDFCCTSSLVRAAKKLNKRYHIGISVSSDTFYPGQGRVDTYSNKIIRKLQGSMEEWKQMGVMSYEMESATLFTMCQSQPGLVSGSILGVIIHRAQQMDSSFLVNKSIICEVERYAIDVVIEAARYLLVEE